jgi:hypothetical protein
MQFFPTQVDLRSMDFTLTSYNRLIETLLSQGFSFSTFSKLLNKGLEVIPQKTIILRHDVEQRYENALLLAQIQNELGIVGSYYFRILPNSFNPQIIKKIAELGHEIGYHYDDLTKCKGNYSMAISRFDKNLTLLRNIAEVKTICMDGSPMSSFDNKDLWGKFNYQDFGIIGEPYFDIDFNKFFYLTDTGRSWHSWKLSMRDKMLQQDKWAMQGLVFRSTNDIIKGVKESRLPDKVMITFHPQRWNDKPLPWLKELIWQNVKNQGKRILIKVRSKERRRP